MDTRRSGGSDGMYSAIVGALAGESQVTAALERVMEILDQTLGLETGWVWLRDAQTHSFYLAAAHNLPPFLQRPVEMTGEPCWCMESFVDGDFTANDVDILACSRLRIGRGEDAGLTGGLRSHASVLLRAGRGGVGLMNLTARHRAALSEDELGTLSTIGALVGLAIDRARLTEEGAARARSDERTRIAREIHDTLAQDLTAIALQLESVLRHMPANDAGRARLESALVLAREGLNRARSSVVGLRADPLGGQTLGAALSSLTHAFGARTGILVAVSVDPEITASSGVEAELFAVAGEALTNVERHALARRLDLTLRQEATEIVLVIDDDGRGYTPDDAGPERYGVVGMDERMRSVGGGFRIECRPQGGTRIEARVPASDA